MSEQLPFRVLATEVAERQMLSIGEGGQMRHVKNGMLLTILKTAEVVNDKVLVVESGKPLVKVFFAIKECCDDCNNGKLHHWSYESTFDKMFEEVQDVSSSLYPVKAIMDMISEMYRIINPDRIETVQKISTATMSYSCILANNGRTMFLDKGNGASSIRFAEDECIAKVLVDPLISFYESNKKKLDRIKEINAEIPIVLGRLK
jgi:hypothetical protein